MLNWIYIVIVHRNNNMWLNMLLHSDALSSFRANLSLLLHLKALWLVDKQQIPILQSLVLPNRCSNPQSTALQMSTLTITPMMWCKRMRKKVKPMKTKQFKRTKSSINNNPTKTGSVTVIKYFLSQQHDTETILSHLQSYFLGNTTRGSQEPIIVRLSLGYQFDH